MSSLSKFLIAGSLCTALAAPGLAHANATGGDHHPGTSRGANVLKLSVLENNSAARLRQLKGALRASLAFNTPSGIEFDTRNVVSLLDTGYRAPIAPERNLHPALEHLALGMHVDPWRVGQRHVLTSPIARAIATRIHEKNQQLKNAIMMLHDSGHITDSERNNGNEVVGRWQHVANAYHRAAHALETHGVAVSED